MARAGYGNMAMTACFAGPLCNILCGLGLGWLLLLLADSPQRSAHVVRHFLLVCLTAISHPTWRLPLLMRKDLQ